MSQIPGSVRVTGFIAPADSEDTYPSHDSKYGKGGYREVETIDERNAIHWDKRREGMLVYVVETNKIYQFINDHFVEFESVLDILPQITENDANKILSINDSANNIEWVDNISIENATETTAGIVQLATKEEVKKGIIDNDDDESEDQNNNNKVLTINNFCDSPTVQISNVIYNGEDLTIKFAEEIENYYNNDAWEWIRDRIRDKNYNGIYIADWIPFIINDDEVIHAQIAGINTYIDAMWYDLSTHIDFISKQCLSINIPWNLTESNNGTEEIPGPWNVSNINKYLNEDIRTLLPIQLQNRIEAKALLVEERYDSQNVLTMSTSMDGYNIGKLWLPMEYEIIGSRIWSSEYACSALTQYPLFAHNKRTIIKKNINGDKVNWWLASVRKDDSVSACCIDENGAANTMNVTANNVTVPICFRIY